VVIQCANCALLNGVHMKKVLNAVLLSVSMMISNAQAECPKPQTSQGGAWLLVASEAVRIRFEEKDGEYDIGLKIIGVGEEFKRVTRAKDDESIVELTGVGSESEAVNVVLVGDSLVIRIGDRMMVRKSDGSLACSNNGGSLVTFKQEMRRNGAVIKTSGVSATTYEAFARQMGL